MVALPIVAALVLGVLGLREIGTAHGRRDRRPLASSLCADQAIELSW